MISAFDKTKQKVWYLAFCDDGHHEEEERHCSAACLVKVNEISRTLIKNNFEVDVVSPAFTFKRQHLKFRGRSSVLSSGANFSCFSTTGHKGKLFRAFNMLITMLKAFLYLVHHAKKNDYLLVYHSVKLITFCRFFLLFKRLRFILEVEDIYADFYPSKKTLRKRENSYISKAPYYIFCSDIVRDRFDPAHNHSAMIYGLYHYYGIGEPLPNSVVYAGSIDSIKQSAWLALESTRFLGEGYSFSFLVYGSEKDVTVFQKRFDEIKRSSKCHLFLSTAPLEGNAFITFLQKFRVGLAVQKDGIAANSTFFPSKVLAYLSCNLLVIANDIESLKRSPISSAIHYVESDDPRTVAKAIVETCHATVPDYSSLFAKLSRSFEEELLALFQIPPKTN